MHCKTSCFLPEKERGFSLSSSSFDLGLTLITVAAIQDLAGSVSNSNMDCAARLRLKVSMGEKERVYSQASTAPIFTQNLKTWCWLELFLLGFGFTWKETLPHELCDKGNYFWLPITFLWSLCHNWIDQKPSGRLAISKNCIVCWLVLPKQDCIIYLSTTRQQWMSAEVKKTRSQLEMGPRYISAIFVILSSHIWQACSSQNQIC